MAVKFKDIKVGKKYYARYTEFSKGKNVKTEFYRTYYVLDKDIVKRAVLASCSGSPAKWIGIEGTKRWFDELPDNAGVPQQRMSFGPSRPRRRPYT